MWYACVLVLNFRYLIDGQCQKGLDLKLLKACTCAQIPDHTPIPVAIAKRADAIAAVSASHTCVFQEVIEGTPIIQFIGCHG